MIYLPLLELFTSYARMAKSGINIWKSTLIYKFGNFIKRITKRNIKVISAFAYKPQEMKKNTILLITGFVVLNLLGIALIAVLFALNSGIFIFLALILTACLLAADIYGAYKASKYMGELDKSLPAPRPAHRLKWICKACRKVLKSSPILLISKAAHCRVPLSRRLRTNAPKPSLSQMFPTI